jgi:hypothetical protein
MEGRQPPCAACGGPPSANHELGKIGRTTGGVFFHPCRRRLEREHNSNITHSPFKWDKFWRSRRDALIRERDIVPFPGEYHVSIQRCGGCRLCSPEPPEPFKFSPTKRRRVGEN